MVAAGEALGRSGNEVAVLMFHDFAVAESSLPIAFEASRWWRKRDGGWTEA